MTTPVNPVAMIRQRLPRLAKLALDLAQAVTTALVKGGCVPAIKALRACRQCHDYLEELWQLAGAPLKTAWPDLWHALNDSRITLGNIREYCGWRDHWPNPNTMAGLAAHQGRKPPLSQFLHAVNRIGVALERESADQVLEANERTLKDAARRAKPYDRQPGRPARNDDITKYARAQLRQNPKLTLRAIIRAYRATNPNHPILKATDPVSALRNALRRRGKGR